MHILVKNKYNNVSYNIMSGSQSIPLRPVATSLTKEEGKKISKAELKRRVDYVADVLRRVYALNRRDVSVVGLATTARNELQQSTLRQYLRQPENIELVNNIYEQRTGVVGGTSENLSMQINPIVYPQLFKLKTEMERKRVGRTVKERVALRQEAPAKELSEAQEQQLQVEVPAEADPTGIKRITTKRIPTRRPRLVQPVADIGVGLPPAVLRGEERSEIEAQELPAPEIGLFDIGEAQRLELQSRRRERQSRPRVPQIERPIVPQIERIERRINNENQNATGIVEPVTANVPADPEQQILEEAQQGGSVTLPVITNNQETIQRITNQAPEPTRGFISDVLRGIPVNFDDITDEIITQGLQTLNTAVIGGVIPRTQIKSFVKQLRSRLGLRFDRLYELSELPAILASPVVELERFTGLVLSNLEDRYSPEIVQRYRNIINRTLVSIMDEETEDREVDILMDLLASTLKAGNQEQVNRLLNDLDRLYSTLPVSPAFSEAQGVLVNTVDAADMIRKISIFYPDMNEQGRTEYRTQIRDLILQRGVPQTITDRFMNNIFDAMVRRHNDEPIAREKREKEVDRMERRQEAVTSAQTGAGIGAVTGAGVVGVGEVAAGILGSSVGAVTSGIVGGGLAGAGASMAAQRMGAGRGGQIGAGVAGGLLAGGAVLAGRKGDIRVPSVSVREQPIEIPQQVVQQEQEDAKGKGTLRPKFIIPSASILDQTESQIQADMDEFAAFDYVIPTSEGTEGNIKNNPLKQQAGIEYRLRFDGAGVDVTSLFGEPVRTNENELKQDFIGDMLDKLPRLEVGVMDEDNLVGANIVSPYRWDSSIQVPEYRSPYKNYTRVTDLDYKINKSQLYGIQY